MIQTTTRQSGFGIVETLMVAGIIAISMLGLGAGLRQMQQTRVEVRGVSGAIALESALQTAIQDPTQYAAIKTILQSTGTTNVPAFNYTVRMLNRDGTAELSPPPAVPVTFNPSTAADIQYRYFDRDGQPCSAGACTDWAFRVFIMGKRKLTSPFPIYAMAYEIEFNPNELKLVGLGSKTGGGLFFSEDDYRWLIPIEAYRDVLVNAQCDPSVNGTIVTGMNKDTNEVYCMRVGDSANTCGANQVATGWEVATVGSEKVLRLGCRTLPETPVCPSFGGPFDYVVQSFTPETFTSSPTAQCVFVANFATADNSVNMLASSCSRSATFTSCPANYQFIPAVGTSNGCYLTSIAKRRAWINVGCGPGFTGDNWVRIEEPDPLSVSGVITGNQVTCTLNNDYSVVGGTDNWKGWEAQIGLRGKCQLSDTEFKTP